MEFKFPDVGEGIVEGEIVEWLVKEGDTVKEDQPIVKIETDKAVVDVPSPASGKISKINFKKGDTIKVGEVLVVIDDGKGSNEEDSSKEKNEPKEEKEEVKGLKEKVKAEEKPKEGKKESVGVIGELEEASEEESEVKEKPAEVEEEKIEKDKVLAMPSVRKIAKEKGIDISKIKGSGKKGQITKEDIEKESGGKETEEGGREEKKPSGIKVEKKYDVYGYVERVPLKGVRKTIAKNMLRSSNETAPVSSFIDVDVTHLWYIRETEKTIAEKEGIKLTFLPFIIKAVVAGLKLYPFVNSSIENEEIVLKKYYNIGIAVDTKDGLLVPVVKRVDIKEIRVIAKEIEELAGKAKDRSIDIADLKGSTFTITNWGSIGGNYGTPIINYPECAILGVGRIEELPRIVNGKIVARRILPLSVTFDHRIVDGAEIGRFLMEIKKRLEDPALLLV